MVVLAVMFTAVWLRSREPGTWLLAIGFAVASGWYFLSPRAPNTGADIDTLAERVSAAAVGVAILLRAIGVALYLGWSAGWMRRFVLLCCLPALASIAWLAVGGVLSHRAFHVAGLLPYLGVALLAFERARREPGNAHGLLGVALLTLPLLPFALAAAGVDTGDLRYYTGVAVIVFGMLVLTVSLLRRHRALAREIERRTEAEAQLRDANQRLEARVAERTAHLHELVAGLESFNRGVSHDLRGPLGGMAQLARTAVDAMARGDATLATRALPLIADQCDASVKMVNAMLELARVAETPAQHVPVAWGDRLTIRAEIEILAPCEQLIVSYHIKDRHQQHLLGGHTGDSARLYPHHCRPGERLRVRFELPVRLHEGAYSLTLLVAGIGDLSRYTDAVLGAHDLTRLFDRVISGDSLSAKKPDPAGIHSCLEQFEVERERALFVGDSSIDVATARNAGVQVWALPYGYNMGEPIETCAPDRVIADFSALLTTVPTTAPA